MKLVVSICGYSRRRYVPCVLFLLITISQTEAQVLNRLQEIVIPPEFKVPKDERMDVDVTLGAGYNTASRFTSIIAYRIRNPFSGRYPSFQQHVDAANPIYPFGHGLSFRPMRYPGYTVPPHYLWRRYRANSRMLSLVAEPGQLKSNYYINWLEPGLTDYDLKGLVNVYWFKHFRTEYSVQRLGGMVGAAKDFTNHLRIDLTYRNELTRIINIAANAPPPVTSQAGKHNLAMWRTQLIYSNMDDHLFHQQGFFLLSEAALAGIPAGGTVNFWRFRSGASEFIRLGEFPKEIPNVLVLRGEVGFSGPAFGADEVPIYERLFAGGIGSVRGYANRTIGPVENGIPVGGNMLVLASIEYGFHVLDPYVRTFLFVDTGTLLPEPSFDFVSSMRGSAGVGIELYNPGGVFPIIFNYVPLHFNEAPTDSLELLTFALALSF